MNFNILTLIIDVLFVLIITGGLFAGGYVFYLTIYKNKDIFAGQISDDVRDELRDVKDEIIKKVLQEIKNILKNDK